MITALASPAPSPAPSTEVVETLFRSARTVVLRVRRAGGETFILKAPAADVPDARELARYRHELKLLEQARAEGVVGALGIEARAGSLQLALEDIGGRSLDVWLKDGALEPAKALELMVRAAEILARV